jgi:hypothetical protein
MDSILNGWIPSPFHGLFFGWQPSNFFIPYPLWNPYGMSMEWFIPYGFHGLVHVDSMEFLMNLEFINCNSMYYSMEQSMEQSIWIPWNSSFEIPWKDSIQCVVKNSTSHENRTLNSMKHHVRKRANALTATPYDCCKVVD